MQVAKPATFPGSSNAVSRSVYLTITLYPDESRGNPRHRRDSGVLDMSVKTNLFTALDTVLNEVSASLPLETSRRLKQLDERWQKERGKRLAAEQRLRERKKQEELNRAKILFADSVSVSSSTILVGELAKILKQNGMDTGQHRFFERLRQDGYLYRTKSGQNLPTQRSLELGVLCVKETSIVRSNGRVSLTLTPKVTGKGQVYFVNKYLGR